MTLRMQQDGWLPLWLVPMTGLKDHEPDIKMPYLAFEPAELMGQASIISAIFLDDGTNLVSAQLERLHGDNYFGVLLRQNGSVTDVFLNQLAQGRVRHRNACINANGWETDAYLTAVTFPEGSDQTNPDKATRYFIADGSYLRRDGKVVFDSLSKVFLTATQQGRQLDVLLQGQPAVQAHLRVGSQPAVVSLNRESVKPLYDADAQAILLTPQNKPE